MSTNWRPKLRVSRDGQWAEAWCYYSDKHAQVYVRPLDGNGKPLFHHCIVIHVPLNKPKLRRKP